jgi:hypothetical protein
MSDHAAQTPIEDLRRAALEHYDNLSTKTHEWMNTVPIAINEYYDRQLRTEPPDIKHLCREAAEKICPPSPVCDFKEQQAEIAAIIESVLTGSDLFREGYELAKRDARAAVGRALVNGHDPQGEIDALSLPIERHNTKTASFRT